MDPRDPAGWACGYVARPDVAVVSFEESPPLGSPASWLALEDASLARRTRGRDDPGRLRLFGVRAANLLGARRDPEAEQLRAGVSGATARPGLLRGPPAGRPPLFRDGDKIDHEAIWIGDGTVLQSTRHNVPGVQITPFDSPFLKPVFRYARRLRTTSAGKSGPELNAAKLHDLKRALDAIAESSGARFGIVFKDLGSGLSLSKNSSVSMHAASTMKTPVMLEVLRRVDEGSLKLTDELPVKNEFRSLVDGSPSRSASSRRPTAHDGLPREDRATRVSPQGDDHPFLEPRDEPRPLAGRPGGGPEVHRRARSEDGEGPAVCRGLEGLREGAQQRDGRGRDGGRHGGRRPDAETVGRGEGEGVGDPDGQVFNDQIPAGLHPQSGAVIGHKTGSISSVQHDAAVVRLPDGREYVLVLLADDFGAKEEGRGRVVEASRKMSRAVWEAMIAPDAGSYSIVPPLRASSIREEASSAQFAGPRVCDASFPTGL